MLRIEEIVGNVDDDFRDHLLEMGDERLRALLDDSHALRHLLPLGVSYREAVTAITAILEYRANPPEEPAPPPPKKKRPARKKKVATTEPDPEPEPEPVPVEAPDGPPPSSPAGRLEDSHISSDDIGAPNHPAVMAGPGPDHPRRAAPPEFEGRIGVDTRDKPAHDDIKAIQPDAICAPPLPEGEGRGERDLPAEEHLALPPLRPRRRDHVILLLPILLAAALVILLLLR